jgi:phage/conjugal plasmid C-4 type zinc finger TraR family protein
MADISDRASDTQALHTAAALAAIPKYEGVSAHICEDCGTEISRRRREVVPGVTVCMPCQGWREVLAERFVN